jgi:hypothetical protein
VSAISRPSRDSSPSAAYRPSPYEPSEVGHEAIKAFWLDDDGTAFTMKPDVVAVDGDTARSSARREYVAPGHQEYRDLWCSACG